MYCKEVYVIELLVEHHQVGLYAALVYLGDITENLPVGSQHLINTLHGHGYGFLDVSILVLGYADRVSVVGQHIHQQVDGALHGEALAEDGLACSGVDENIRTQRVDLERCSPQQHDTLLAGWREQAVGHRQRWNNELSARVGGKLPKHLLVGLCLVGSHRLRGYWLRLRP